MDIDYANLGLRVGIEVHQQLSGRKLFCNCSPDNDAKDPAHRTVRQMRASAGEEGLVDAAAEHETKKGKYYVYNSSPESSCLVELDEEPPNQLSMDALKTAVLLALMLKSYPVELVQVMRKTVVDGSNTSGFQRTALVATGGRIGTPQGNVGISVLCIEEDAARIVERKGECDTYDLSRLGVPLIEIGTEPDIKSPEQALEVAKRLGMMLRSTRTVKRGIGTIRQDINISIRGGSRVEIKGAQDLHILQKLIETECIRQLRLINIKKMLESGNIKPKAYDIKDITAILKTSNSRLVSKAISDRGVALAVKLEGFKGILGSEAQPNRRFGSELADYARVSANVGGIIHSDELPGYGITDEHINKIIKLLSCNERDGFVIVLDARHKAERALRAVIGRVKAAFLGVPEEVRRAYPDSSTSFLRPMPGAARMYPETDIPPIPITADLISSIKLPELISETADRLASVGISRDLAEQLSRSNKAELFDDLCAEYRNVDPGFIASTLVLAPKEIKTRLKLDSSLITDEAVDKILGYLDSGIIGKDAVFEMLCEVASGKKPRPEDYRVLSDEELREAVKDVISQNKDAPPKALIGKVMSRLRGRADGKRIALIVKENFE